MVYGVPTSGFGVIVIYKVKFHAKNNLKLLIFRTICPNGLAKFRATPLNLVFFCQMRSEHCEKQKKSQL